MLDGRDIGTVICPEARAKLFVTATPEVRAARRHKELIGRGEAVPPSTASSPISAGATRAIPAAATRRSRRRKTPITLDTSALTVEEAVAAAIDVVDGRRAG